MKSESIVTPKVFVKKGQNLVTASGLSKVYNPDSLVPVHALKNVDFTVTGGEFTAISGPSGSGKSTLLNLIAGLDSASSGSVNVAGNDIIGMNKNDLAEFRLHNLGFIFQAYNLVPVLTAVENVEFTMLLQGVTEKERRQRALAELEALGLAPELAHRRPAELSGGQQQRVAVARALVTSPAIVLADEPTANLDSKTGALLLDKMKEMNEKTGVTFIFSTHDHMVMDRARRLVTLRDGEIVSDEVRE